MATTDRGPVQTARLAFANARRALIDRLFEADVAQKDLDEAKRSQTGSDLEAFQAALADAAQALADARQAETQALTALQNALATWLPPGTPIEDDFVRLASTSPIVLFPVRLETRFVPGSLRVRVFPDEIFLNTHETALTVEEEAAARHYYEELNQKDNEKELWRDIVARFGVERSAYILREMLPIFGAPDQASSYWASSSTCGGTIYGGNDEQLFFPSDVQRRSSAWTRPGEALLPERWIFVTYRGSERKIYTGNLIPEPLALTGNPSLPGEESLSTLIPTTRGDYKIDDNIRWTVDFERAVQVGMGIEIPLTAPEATGGFDRLIAVGIKSSLTELETSRLLEKLFDAHHYTRGVAIVRQGSPTNNTQDRPTSYPPRENAGQLSYGIERQRAPLDREFAHHCLPKDTDGYALAFMLGVPSGVMANIDRAYEKEIDRAHVMNRALWPGTLGYFMRHMMDPVFTPTQIENARSYFERYVLARGPAPAFRIGGTPYGVLPIASLSEWSSRSFGGANSFDDLMQGVENAMLKPLQQLFSIWKAAAHRVPRLKPNSANPDVDLAVVMSTQPSSQEFRVRFGESLVSIGNLFFLEGWDMVELANDLDRQSRETFGRIGFPAWRPLLGKTVWKHPSWLYPVTPVASELSETAALPGFNLVTSIASASARQLNAGSNPGANFANLLYVTLRHSTLAEYSRIAAANTTTQWIEYGLWNLLPTTVSIIPSVYQLDDEGRLKGLASKHIQALEQLAQVPTAELERLLTETLDAAAYRLDAWITALAYRRIDDMRRVQESNQLATKGDFLGGYGWLLDVRPRPATTQTLPDGRAIQVQSGNGGFVHTPSMSHASAAAILRNGHLNFRAARPAAHAVDLSSRRVRDARYLFDAIRNGQHVGAVLGYKFERALHESYPGTQDLDALRFALRARFPLVANKNGHDADAPAEAIAARNVVDGKLLLEAYQANLLTFGVPPLPAVGSAQYNAMVAELKRLEDHYDAAADLLTAEGVFQLVRGNTDAGFPTMEGLVEGHKPPDTIISRSARGGTGIAHRVALVFPNSASLTLPGNWPALTARAAAEPTLDGWLGQLIGNPSDVSARVTYFDESGEVIPSGGQLTVTVTLDELGLRPLDVFALAEAVARQDQGSMLDRRLLDVVLNDPTRAPSQTPTRFGLEYTTTQGRSFSQVFEILNTAGAVLRSSRPLGAADLLSSAELDLGLEEQEADALARANAQTFYGRGQTAKSALGNMLAELDAAVDAPPARRAALRAAAFFAPLSAFPDPTLSDDGLADATLAARKELQRRLDSLPAGIAATSRISALLAHGQATLKGVFGAGFVAMPALDPPRPDELDLSLSARTTLLAGDDAAPGKYLQQIMRSRDRLGRFRKLNLYARTVGLARPHVHVVQLPHVPGEKWLGLPFETPPEKGRTALLLLSYTDTLDATEPWSGLVIDDWSEIIPNRVEDTGFAMHYKGPHAEAPQAILVAAPSRNATNWSFAELLASLEQTTDLMQIRAVTQDYHDMGQVFPAVVFGSNPNVENTVSTVVPGIVQAAGEALSNG